MDNSILKCNKCGEANNNDYKYCKNCGVDLKSKIEISEEVFNENKETFFSLVGKVLMIVGVMMGITIPILSIYYIKSIIAALIIAIGFSVIYMFGKYLRRREKMDHIIKEVEASTSVTKQIYEEEKQKKEKTEDSFAKRLSTIFAIILLGFLCLYLISTFLVIKGCYDLVDNAQGCYQIVLIK